MPVLPLHTTVAEPSIFDADELLDKTVLTGHRRTSTASDADRVAGSPSGTSAVNVQQERASGLRSIAGWRAAWVEGLCERG